MQTLWSSKGRGKFAALCLAGVFLLSAGVKPAEVKLAKEKPIKERLVEEELTEMEPAEVKQAEVEPTEAKITEESASGRYQIYAAENTAEMKRHNIALTPGTSHYAYQWALKNTGNIQRISKEHPDSPALTNSGEGGSGEGTGGQPGAGDSAVEKVTGSVAGVDINIEPAWEVYTQSESRRLVTVAIIDTGVDISHPELKDAIWVNEDEIPGDGVDNDGNGYVDDVNGWNFVSGNNQIYMGGEDSHGTHGAGTIAGAWDNKGISGIADGAYVKIMVLKALSEQDGKGDSTHVKNAIRYAQQNGADICNLSMGSDIYDEELDALIRNSCMLFVVSAGNGNQDGQGYDIDVSPVYPAAFSADNIISVANLMFDGTLDQSSNYGKNSVDIAAPGTYILSTVPGGEYDFMSGTSMAAPMVTGAAALICSCRPDLGLSDVRRAILSSARRMEGVQGKVACDGMLDLYAAITYFREQ